MKKISINHPLEYYLISFYDPEEDYSVEEIPLHRQLYEKAMAEDGQTDLEERERILQKAAEADPADLEIREAQCRLLIEKGDWTALKRTVWEMYPYCFTRRDMASFYRLLGCYSLETYQPEAAYILYSFSKLYSDSPAADSEIRFLQKAMGKTFRNYEQEELLQALDKLQVPGEPVKETMTMVYRIGSDYAGSEQEQDRKYGEMLLRELYAITGDPELEKYGHE